jgi:hypothetical protein
VEDYFKEMEMIMMHAKIDENEEQTMAHFFNGLTFPIKRIVEFLPYTTLCELVHQASRAERQVQEDAKHERSKAFFAFGNDSSSPIVPQGLLCNFFQDHLQATSSSSTTFNRIIKSVNNTTQSNFLQV